MTDVLKGLEDATTVVTDARAYVSKTDWVKLRGSRTQEDMAKAAGVSQTTICRLERGEGGKIRTATLVRLIRAYTAEAPT